MLRRSKYIAKLTAGSQSNLASMLISTHCVQITQVYQTCWIESLTRYGSSQPLLPRSSKPKLDPCQSYKAAYLTFFLERRLHVVYFPQIGYLIVVPGGDTVDMLADDTLEQQFSSEIK